MPTSTLELARDSLRRLRQIDDELEAMRSRIGGQGTGMSPKIDHSIILDVMRNVDDYMESEQELPIEKELCERDIENGWVVIFGVEGLIKDEEKEMGDELRELIIHVLALRYLYAKSWNEIPKIIRHDRLSGRDLCEITLRWMEKKGLAQLKEAAANEGEKTYGRRREEDDESGR